MVTAPHVFAARKAKWVAALRSGKYEQANGVLKEGTYKGPKKYCCLGVGCTLAGFRSIYFAPDYEDGEPEWGFEFRTAVVKSMPGREFAEWLGLEIQNIPGYYVDGDDPGHAVNIEVLIPAESWYADQGTWKRLDELNDSEGYTFKEIADAIEKYEMRATWGSGVG